jgi:hypothetical protein
MKTKKNSKRNIQIVSPSIDIFPMLCPDRTVSPAPAGMGTLRLLLSLKRMFNVE